MGILIIPIPTIIQTVHKSKEIFPMRDANIKKLVLAALMAALTYVATSHREIPSPMRAM